MSNLKKYKIFILVISGLLMMIAVILYVVLPEYQKLTDLKAENLKRSLEIGNAQNKLSSLISLSNKTDEVAKQKNYTDKQIPNDIQATVFVSYLEIVGRTMAITPLTVSVNTASGQSKDKEATGRSTFNLTFSSNFTTALNFFNQLEKLERLNSISSFSLGASGDGTLNSSVSGDIYFNSKKK